MKKSILLFTTVAGFLYLSLSSNAGGASQNGHAKAKDGCSGAGCHGAASTSVTSTIVVKEKSSGNTVTEYEAGVDYEVTVTGMGATPSDTAFGYMARFVDASTMQAGTFSNPSSGSKVQLVSGGVSVVEHSSAIIDPSGTFTATFDWQAPAAGTGDVSVNLAVNSVNHNGTADAGDVFSTSSLTLTEKNTSVGSIAGSIEVSTYPNPTQNVLNIDLKNAQSGTYQLTAYNIAGQVVANEEINVNGSATTQISTSTWKAGLYIIRLSKDGAQRSVKVLKQ